MSDGWMDGWSVRLSFYGVLIRSPMGKSILLRNVDMNNINNLTFMNPGYPEQVTQSPAILTR